MEKGKTDERKGKQEAGEYKDFSELRSMQYL